MFEDEEVNAFYEGKQNGYDGKEYTNPHEAFISGLGGAAAIAEGRKHDQYKRGYEWGKAQKHEEDSQ